MSYCATDFLSQVCLVTASKLQDADGENVQFEASVALN